MELEPLTTAGPPAFPANIRYIENGDALNTGNHQIQAKDVADGLGHLKATKLDTAETRPVTFSDATINGVVKYTSSSVTRKQSAYFFCDDPAVWAIGAHGVALQQTALGTEASLPLDLPHNAVLTSVVVRVSGAAGHSALPAGMPSIGVLYLGTGVATTSLGTASDASADVAAYEVAHSITVTGLSHMVDAQARRYFVRVIGELGGNFVAGLTALSVDCTYTVTEQDKG